MKVTLQALTDVQIEDIHQKTLDLLWRHGIAIHDQEACQLFAARGAKVDGEIVRIPASLLEEGLSTVPSSFSVCAWNRANDINIGAQYPLVVASCSGVSSIIDWDNNQRAATLDDLKTLLKLTQTSPVVNTCTPTVVYPRASDSRLGLYQQMYYAITMSDKAYIGLSENPKIAKASIDVAKLAIGTDGLVGCVGIANSLAPMAWDGTMLQTIKTFAENGQAINISCCSMAGATAPVYLAGSVLSANAEVLTGILYSQLVRPGTPVIYGTTSSIMDMRSMTLSLGAPEYPLISTACAQMAQRYRIPFRSGGCLSDAKTVDVQAGVESAINMLFTYFNGVDFALQSVGIMEAFMATSFEKWMEDEEIIQRLQRIERGVGEIPDDIVDIISDGTVKRNYIEHDTTLDEFRDMFFLPTLADRQNFHAWTTQQKSSKAIARAAFDKRISAYQQPEMDSSVWREIRAYFQILTGVDFGAN